MKNREEFNELLVGFEHITHRFVKFEENYSIEMLADIARAWGRLKDVEKVRKIDEIIHDWTESQYGYEDISGVLWSIGDAWFRSGNLPRAVSLMEKSLSLLKEEEDERAVRTFVVKDIATVIGKSDNNRAKEILDEELEYVGTLKDTFDQLDGLAYLSEAWVKIGEFTEASSVIKRAIAIINETKNPEIKEDLNYNLTLNLNSVYQETGNADLIKFIIECSMGINDKCRWRRAWQKLAFSLIKNKEMEEALEIADKLSGHNWVEVILVFVGTFINDVERAKKILCDVEKEALELPTKTCVCGKKITSARVRAGTAANIAQLWEGLGEVSRTRRLLNIAMNNIQKIIKIDEQTGAMVEVLDSCSDPPYDTQIISLAYQIFDDHLIQIRNKQDSREHIWAYLENANAWLKLNEPLKVREIIEEVLLHCRAIEDYRARTEAYCDIIQFLSETGNFKKTIRIFEEALDWMDSIEDEENAYWPIIFFPQTVSNILTDLERIDT